MLNTRYYVKAVIKSGSWRDREINHNTHAIPVTMNETTERNVLKGGCGTFPSLFLWGQISGGKRVKTSGGGIYTPKTGAFLLVPALLLGYKVYLQ